MREQTYSQDWVLRDYDFDRHLMKMVSFRGRKIGAASSRATDHDHEPGRTARRGERCSACRWLEVRIYVDEDARVKRARESGNTQGGYVLETIGRSEVDGEHNRYRTRMFHDPFLVVAKLTKRVDDSTFLPIVAQEALEEAAERDEPLGELLQTLSYGPHEVRYSDARDAEVHTEIEEDDEVDEYNLVDPTLGRVS